MDTCKGTDSPSPSLLIMLNILSPRPPHILVASVSVTGRGDLSTRGCSGVGGTRAGGHLGHSKGWVTGGGNGTPRHLRADRSALTVAVGGDGPCGPDPAVG